MTISTNSDVWVVMRVDQLSDNGGVPAGVIAEIDNKRRAMRTSNNDFASAMRLVEQEVY